MSPEISERSFEEAIECGLLQYGPDSCVGRGTEVRETPPPFGDTPPGGYHRRKPEDYDRTRCLLPGDVVDFVLATQPKEWQKLAQHHGKEGVKEEFLKRLAAEIERRGALEVLRQGIKDSGVKFRLAYFRPASGLNEETRRLHAANLFAVVRQLHYSTKNENSLDLVLFMNGIPIFTAELRNPLNGQDAEDAIRQYKTDRDPRKPLLAYGRCLAHFAVDPDLVYVATRLATLHDAGDRRVLDRQLQTTMRQFEQTLGVVENIDTTSRQLKDALESGKTIIVTTLQKFPVIAKEIGELPGKRFALIVDEAHSSQSGESTKSLKAVLTSGSLEAAEAEEAGAATPEEELENAILAEMEKRGRAPNLSTFAFTATPKAKTLELFGTERADGKFAPFHLYTMRQAIEEGFILDVLASYTTYTAYWRLLKKIKDDPRYDKRKAEYLLKSFVELHPHAIGEKVAICVEHFASKVQGEIFGRAKAMIVTRSRLHAVRYRLAVDRYLAERGYPFKALVAFSGAVEDGGRSYTETGMNGSPGAQIAKAFEGPEYRFLIVANKFQTGFDQPLLHTMYVDKKLGGVNAVQTLSRLNRTPWGQKTHPMAEARSYRAVSGDRSVWG